MPKSSLISLEFSFPQINYFFLQSLNGLFSAFMLFLFLGHSLSSDQLLIKTWTQSPL